MSLSLAKDLINICLCNNIKYFTLIGGEPTLHENFFEIIKYLTDNNCNITIVTNGIKLKDISFCEKIKNLDNENIRIGISLKGSSRNDYKILCGSNSFESVLQGIKNCRELQLKFSFSFVISSENIDKIEKFSEEIRFNGINESIAFSYCNDVLFENGEFNTTNSYNPIEIDNILSNKYEKLTAILENKFLLHQSLPLCMCNKQLLDKMKENKQIITSCHVHNRTGVVFDTNGAILLCNHFVGFGIGEYGKDYYDAISFKNYWDSVKMMELHKKLVSIPDEECAKCEIRDKCGGGCCIQWFSHSFEEYKKSNFNNQI
jgi:radical SAM protein with 4Fe4S-binding SPASM domain